MSDRPKLNLTLKAFKEVYNTTVKDVPAVGTFIGGNVNHNINNLTPAEGKFENACAIRMSYALNKAGSKVPFIRGKTVSGKNGNWYIYTVETLKQHLIDTFGEADVSVTTPKPLDFKNKKGILIFDVNWQDATGHATIWDGVNCSDKCYFPKASKAYLWELKD
ncbi:MAG: type VI secretion system amidase effector protein Tae4 [Gammaproteobacteria bacterium]|nr:type VI secretion system amidase effector protein Tae4 [Gammaproteobacteria bacterium]